MADNVKLTPKQKAFCEYYLQSFNATKAARAAGYSEKHINTNASKLLQNTTIKDYIEKVNNKAMNKRILTLEQIKEFYSNVVGSEDADLKDRISAADKLSKYVGLSSAEEKKYKNEAKKLEMEEKKLEILAAREKVIDDGTTGVVMIPGLDIDSYEKEKEEFLKGIDING